MSVLLFLVLLVQLAQAFILNRILMQLSNPDFTSEDEQLNAETEQVSEAKKRLPRQNKNN